MMRDALAAQLVEDGRFAPVHLAATGDAAWAIFTSKPVDLVLMDIELPDHDGIVLARNMVAVQTKLPVIAVSCHCDDYTTYRIRRSPIIGYVDKCRQQTSGLIAAIDAILESRTAYAPAYVEAARNLSRHPDAFYKILTPREIQLMPLFGLGLSNEAIAAMVGIAATTVQGHRGNVTAKLELKHARELVSYAVARGFVRSAEVEEAQAGRVPPYLLLRENR